ncbi:MAG: YwiC-like family protein [Verrucomicrobia bacterium]|nr:YwiC-like family protein [Verrucomicrobiota bacterium]
MADSSSLASILVPKERGSWSLALEPVVLGLVAAPSMAGLPLAGAVLAGFLARRPLKLAATLPAVDPRRGPAKICAGLLAGLALLGVAGAAGLASPSALWPLLLAVPFGAAFLWYDLRQAMREAEAELAGSIAFALVPATFATVAARPTAVALALAVLMLARSVPTVLAVRAFLRTRKGQAGTGWPAFGAAVIAWAVTLALASRSLVPGLAPVLVTLLLIRTYFLISPFAPAWSATRLGIVEAVAGAIYVVALGLAAH